MRSVILLMLFLIASPALADSVTGTARILDVDTLDIGDERVRLFGIDAPEVAQPGGKDAIKALARLVEGKSVQCEGAERDDFDRLLASCSTAEGNVNEAMVRGGHAWAFVKYSGVYADLEREARSARAGIWSQIRSSAFGLISAPGPQPPWEFRAAKWKFEEQTAPKGCPIKGNINNKGQKIYHLPWSPWYRKTAIREEAGERWFCSEGEAQKAGWRAPSWR